MMFAKYLITIANTAFGFGLWAAIDKGSFWNLFIEMSQRELEFAMLLGLLATEIM